jgi:hypothetical protein
MPVTDKLSLLARDLHNRAEEALTRAEAMHNAEAREKMRQIAADYERLAQRIEREAGPDSARPAEWSAAGLRCRDRRRLDAGGREHARPRGSSRAGCHAYQRPALASGKAFFMLF